MRRGASRAFIFVVEVENSVEERPFMAVLESDLNCPLGPGLKPNLYNKLTRL